MSNLVKTINPAGVRCIACGSPEWFEEGRGWWCQNMDCHQAKKECDLVRDNTDWHFLDESDRAEMQIEQLRAICEVREQELAELKQVIAESSKIFLLARVHCRQLGFNAEDELTRLLQRGSDITKTEEVKRADLLDASTM